MRGLLGTEVEAFIEALREPRAGLRVNTLRLRAEEFRRISPFELTPLPFLPEGFTLGPGESPGRHPYHEAGLYYLQDPGAMAVGRMVDPRPGELVLDLAAAPGGKASHMAALMGGEGVLVANDVHAGRARELARNIERLGVRTAVVTAETPERLARVLGPVFDRVLVDAPCSGESMFHKSVAAVADWSHAAVAGCARRQSEVLEQAGQLVRPGGLLVYSTCTFSPEENEEAIARFVTHHPEFSVIPLRAPPGAAPGEPAWVPEQLRMDDLTLTARLWPHRMPGAGHFVAGLRRAAAGADHQPLGTESRLDWRAGADAGGTARGLDVPEWQEFRQRSLPALVLAEGSRLIMKGSDLYSIPAGSPNLKGLRVVVSGLWLGALRKGRFEPSHSLAMALRSSEITGSVDLDVAGDRAGVQAYLAGETLRSMGPDGWVVVTVGGFPLGWGKRVKGVVKNHYPKGLRRR